MNVEGYFRSMGNAIAREQREGTILDMIKRDAEKALTYWEACSAYPEFLPHWKERGEPIAANLRGTLKNDFASADCIKSLASDLRWITKRGCGLQS